MAGNMTHRHIDTWQQNIDNIKINMTINNISAIYLVLFCWIFTFLSCGIISNTFRPPFHKNSKICILFTVWVRTPQDVLRLWSCRMQDVWLEAGLGEGEDGVEEKVQATSRSAREHCSRLVTALYRTPPLSTLPNISQDKNRYFQCSYQGAYTYLTVIFQN